ncbi:hypothetical protein BSL78_24223 [Apostichopus japonicus]|uniref:5'-nucleotidase n=1 Tax=Stichopus japonicus TaxID=307972 RepID=A0A2G8JT83_STIJA|nr:hypothetical protein BSL78_24223 [Apostichopus japonicus]
MDTTGEPSLTYLIKKSVVLEIGGEQIGVIGYTTSLAPMLTNTGKLQFEDEVEAVQREVNRLTADGVNKIIAVGHSGYGVDLDIAAKVTGVDVIVGGHSSSFLYTGTPPTNDIPVGLYPTIVQSDIDPAHTTLVVTAYMHGKYLGFLQVEFDEEGTIRHFNGNPILLDSKIKEDKDALIEISKWRKGVNNYLPNIVGESFVLLKGVFNYCEDKECGLGNLVADAMVWKSMVNQGSRGWSDVGVAMINGGAIRSSLNTGTLVLN